MITRAQSWSIPEKDGKPWLMIVQEDANHPQAIGDEGRRPLTNEEYLRWTKFRIDLRRQH